MQIGAEGHLFGIVATPQGAVPNGVEVPTVLLLNAGVIHRVGPHRLHVNLARQLAAGGVTSLRLDLSGIGDSRVVPGALSFRQSAVADTRAAMDRLAADTGARRFVLFGLCSGADNALATAEIDTRVAGLVLVDPPTYPTARARVRWLAARVRKLGGARAVAKWGAGGVARRIHARFARSIGGSENEVGSGRESPPRAVYRAQLTALVERGVAILVVFSGLSKGYNHVDQLFELFPELRGRVDCAYFPDANHTFTELKAQAEFTATVTAWIGRRR